MAALLLQRMLAPRGFSAPVVRAGMMRFNAGNFSVTIVIVYVSLFVFLNLISVKFCCCASRI